MISHPWGERAAQAAHLSLALRPLVDRLGAAWEGGVGDADTVNEPDSLRLCERHLTLWSSAGQHVVDALRQLERDAWQPTAADSAAIERAVGRFEGALERWLRGLSEVRALALTPEQEPLRKLLSGMYSYSLYETRASLECLIAAFDDPLAGVDPDGLRQVPADPIEIVVALELSAPPELEQLLPYLRDAYPPGPDLEFEFEVDCDITLVADRHQDRPAPSAGLAWLAAAFGIGWIAGSGD